MHKQPLGRLPFTGMAGAIDSDHLHLPVDRSAKSATRHRQKGVRVNVPEAHREITEPLAVVAHHLPVVARVADAVFAVARDLLFAGQRTLEVVRVQIAFGRLVLQPDALAALHDRAANRKNYN